MVAVLLTAATVLTGTASTADASTTRLVASWRMNEATGALYMADLSGHGLESGVLMLMVQSVARALYESGEIDSKRFLEILNRTIFKNVARMKSGKHLTLAFVDYDRNKITITGQQKRNLLEQAIADGQSSKLPIGRVLAEVEQPIDIHWCP